MGTFASLRWDVPKDFLSREHFERTLGKLDLTSSPGFPYMRRAPTNRVFFGYSDNVGFKPEMVDYMWALVSDRLDKLGEADAIRLFVKQEPHKLAKIENGRYRLISSVSVADQIIDHMLFDSMNSLMVDHWDDNPIKVGWSPLKGGWKMMPRSKWLAIDKSSWDWTVQMWLCELALQVRVLLCNTKGPLFDRWLEIAVYRYKQLYQNPLFITSGGVLLRQMRPGVQKSGCVNTIADNSLMQWILHARVCLELNLPITDIYAMGDDTLQEPFPEQQQYLERMGQYCILKEAELTTEFAGFRFRGPIIEPMYKGKHAFNLLHVDDGVLDQVAVSYSLLYHRSNYREWMRRFFISIGCEIFPHMVYDIIYDGMEAAHG